MFQCIPNGFFLFGRALGLLGVLRLRLVVALPLDDPAFLLDLGDVEGSDVQSGLLLDVVLDLLVGGFALRGSQIQLIHIEFNLNMMLGMEFGQQDHCLHMPRPREHIHRLHFLHTVAFAGQAGGVAGGGGGVAADVDQAAGGHLEDGGQGGLVAALAGRVHDDDVGGQAPGGQAAGGLTGVGAEKAALGRNGVAHPGRVGFGTLDGLGDHFDAHQGAAAPGHGQTDGAHPAVEVQQQVVGGRGGVGGGHAVKLFGAGSVDLVERKGAQPHRHPAEGVLDKAGAVQDPVFPAEDDVGLVGVDVEEDGADVAEAGAQGGGQLGGMRQAGTGADQAYHDLAAVGSPAQKDVAHQPGAAGLVVGLDAVLVKQPAQGAADLVQDGGLQFAVGTGDDPVAASGVKADAGPPGFVQAHRVLHLVAVAVHFGGGEDGLHRDVQPPDAAEGVGHRGLFCLQLGLVAQMPQAAPPAGPRHRAVGGDAVGGGRLHRLHDAEGIPLAVLDDTGADHVAGGRPRHKDRFALPVADAAAVAGQALDGQCDDLVLL